MSFVEWVIDFELFTGCRVKVPGTTDTSWARKAAIFANLWKAINKYSRGDLKKEKIEGTRYQGLIPFGITGKFNAINKRPRFLMGSKTEEFLARNALSILDNKKYWRLDLPLKYNLIPVPSIGYVDPNGDKLSQILQRRALKRVGLRGEQPNTVP